VQEREHVRCDLCGADRPKEHLEVEGNIFVECSDCGFIYLNPRPLTGFEEVTQATVEGLTEKGYRESRRWYYRRILRGLEQFRNIGRLIEVGCASGGFLKVARDAGWEALGVEIADKLARVGRGRGLDIRTCDVCEADLPAGSFDVAVLNMVIEHLPSPRETLTRLHEVLRLGGGLWIHTPNYASTAIKMARDGCNYPGAHLSCFTPATLTRLCADTGFTVKYSRTTGFRFPGERKAWRKLFEKLASQLLSRLGKGHRLRVLAVRKAASPQGRDVT
jgi:2-polyprenyl-3-methyl-5-hydroxy-6-metoxy-1,4-benzoquinol methylase